MTECTTEKSVPASVAIVGGGIAGVSTAGDLRARGFTGKITLIEPSGIPYDRPPLSKAYLLGEAKRADLNLVPEQWFDAQHVDLVAGAAARLLPGTGEVELRGGRTLAADAVVLATGGGANRRIPVQGLNRPDIHVLRDADDADRLQDALKPGIRLLVVGGGLIGAEVASTAIALGCDVTIVEPAAPPLAAAVGDELAGFLHRQHLTAGVKVVTDTLHEVREASGQMNVLTTRGTHLAADVVLLAVGMSARSGLAHAAGLQVSGGIVVDDDYRTTNPAVYAVGDSACRRANDGSHHRADHWDAARRSGMTAAAAIMGKNRPSAEPSWFWSDRHGVHIEAVGSFTNGARQVVRGRIGEGPVTVFNLDDANRVVGAAAIDDVRTVGVARRLITTGVTADPKLLGDLSIELKKLIRR
ncbi:MAG: hypothetical protein EOO27_05955 [Comamonadaceae bacterium]|nr:MAG: hypothetical protein EOO27_05955 [Comamonadaceae bacterium]